MIQVNKKIYALGCPPANSDRRENYIRYVAHSSMQNMQKFRQYIFSSFFYISFSFSWFVHLILCFNFAWVILNHYWIELRKSIRTEPMFVSNVRHVCVSMCLSFIRIRCTVFTVSISSCCRCWCCYRCGCSFR